ETSRTWSSVPGRYAGLTFWSRPAHRTIAGRHICWGISLYLPEHRPDLADRVGESAPPGRVTGQDRHVVRVHQARIPGGVQGPQAGQHVVVAGVDERLDVALPRHLHEHVAEVDVVDLV